MPSDAMQALVARLPTLAEIEADRRGRPILKGKTRLEKTVEARPLTKIDEKAFKNTVWRRDRNLCRCCGRKVQKVMGRVPERGEVHHIHGRGKDLRFEVRSAVLLCLRDHERVTGRVNYKLAIVGTKTFTMRDETYIDANYPIDFKKVA